MIELLQTISKDITLVEISSARLYPLEKLGYPIITVNELISRLLDTKEASLLCGSLYYVGEVLEKWGKCLTCPILALTIVLLELER